MFAKRSSKFSAASIIFIAASISINGCATLPATDEIQVLSEGGLTVELKEVVGFLVIPVSINGVDLTLTLDTGAVSTTLHENSRTRQFFDKASSSKGISRVDGSNKIIKTKTLKNGLIEVVGLPGKKSDIVLWDQGQSPLHPWDLEKIDGVIGFDLLNYYDVRLEEHEGQLTFFNPGQLVQDNAERTLKINLNDKIPSFNGNLHFVETGDREPAKIFIDTGADTDIRIISPKDPSNWIVSSEPKSFVVTATGVSEYFKTTQLQVLSADGSFSLTSDAIVRHSPGVSTRAILGRPALGSRKTEISYRSGFINFSDGN